MVRKNCVEIKKPVLDCDGVMVIMDRDYLEEVNEHIEEVNEHFRIKKIHDDDTHILLEFNSQKHVTMYNLKYGH